MPFVLVPLMLFVISYSMSNFRHQISENISLSFKNKDDLFYKFCALQENIKIMEGGKELLERGLVSAYIETDEDLDYKILHGEKVNISIEYGNSSINSIMTTPFLNVYEQSFLEICSSFADLAAKNKITYEQAEKILNYYKVPATEAPKVSSDVNEGLIYVSMLAPMMMLLYSCVGSAGCASEITAGEKEHGTLEPLISTGVSRDAIVLGKLLTAAAIGLISSVSAAAGLFGYAILQSITIPNMSLTAFSYILWISIFTSLFFATVNMAIGVFSKSYKEAQTYMMPVSLMVLFPSYYAYFSSVNNIPIQFFSIPILNIVYVIKELFAGIVNFNHLGIVSGWLVIYSVAVYLIIRHMFKKESVIFRI
jgi:sodium transport system permease protein